MENKIDAYFPFHNVLVPSGMINDLIEYERAKEKARRQEEDDELDRQNAEEEAKANAQSLASESDDPNQPDAGPIPGYQGPHCRIFDMADAVRLEKSLESFRSFEQKSRAKALIKQLKEDGEYRKLAVLPEQWRADLDSLEARFPNFAEVIDFVRIQCALAEQTDRVLHLAILLDGLAGTGKSMFAGTLAKWIGGGYECIRFESAQSGSALAGSSEYWGNTKPGVPFERLTAGEYANPTFFLDEVDKVSVREYDPLGPLYALLEPGTAREHADLSWPSIKLDCSHINYIAASNDYHRIPAPLQSRLRMFHIAAPTPDQARAIAHNIVAEEVARHVVSIQFSEGAIDALSRLSPRRMRQQAQEALGRALFGKREIVRGEDIPGEPQEGGRGIGFV